MLSHIRRGYLPRCWGDSMQNKQVAVQVNAVLAVSAAVVLLASSAAWGQQVSGSIGGAVIDKQGAVVPGAKVTIVDVTQGDAREFATNNDGIFFLNPLKPSTYNVTVEAP